MKHAKKILCFINGEAIRGFQICPGSRIHGGRGLAPLRQKSKHNNGIAIKVDESHYIAPMQRSDYNNELLKCLTDSGAQSQQNFDFDNHVAKVQSAINNSKFLSDNAISTKLTLIPNPIQPRLYRLPKVHKTGAPMRPVVCFISAPNTK